MNAVTAEFEVHHHCQRQSVLKKEKHLSSSVEPDVEHCTLTNTGMQSAGLAWNASRKDEAFGASEHARFQRWVHNDLKRERLCVIDDELRILPWQTHSMELPTLVLMYSCWYWSADSRVTLHVQTSEAGVHRVWDGTILVANESTCWSAARHTALMLPNPGVACLPGSGRYFRALHEKENVHLFHFVQPLKMVLFFTFEKER